MDGVLIQYLKECPDNVKKIQSSYPISGTWTTVTGGTPVTGPTQPYTFTWTPTYTRASSEG